MIDYAYIYSHIYNLYLLFLDESHLTRGTLVVYLLHFVPSGAHIINV